MPNIRFSKHALSQLAERRISKNEVFVVLKRPDKIVQQASGRMMAVRMTRNKKYLLVVIYEENEEIMEVVTCFISSKIKKYL